MSDDGSVSVAKTLPIRKTPEWGPLQQEDLSHGLPEAGACVGENVKEGSHEWGEACTHRRAEAQ